ncbi:MAG TPA: ABC transporter permease subunit, partial [Rhodoblastus sp.]|nr:ABC transporter permease subunit [Rhodoblastus sp.]
MAFYVLRRILLMIPTLFGILALSFVIVQFAPGGPVERVIAQMQGQDMGATARFGGANSAIAGGRGGAAAEFSGKYRGAQGLDPKFIQELEKQFGFDKPPLERFWLMIRNYAMFDFGRSYFRDAPVLSLIKEKLPVSMSLGLWMTFLSYIISIPLGIAKAKAEGEAFDIWTSAAIILGYAIPSFLFAILLIVLFAGGSFWQIFPLRGLTSDDFAQLSLIGKIKDYLWHIVLPVSALTLGAFATTTFLTKNAFIDEIRKQYVITARMKGLTE